MIKARLFSLLSSENGVITVDWIVLIAATTVVAFLGVHIIGQSTISVSSDLVVALHDAGVTVPAFEQVSQTPSNSQGSWHAWFRRS